jgi:TolB-like protein
MPETVALQLPDKPSIAVLPFQNMSGDPEQEYFADGIAEDVITLLSKSRGLFVIARNSTFTDKGRAIDVKTVGRELGVRYVLEGSVRKAGGRVRVTAQLIEAATGGHLWAERYDRDLTDIFAAGRDHRQRLGGDPADHGTQRARARRAQAARQPRRLGMLSPRAVALFESRARRERTGDRLFRTSHCSRPRLCRRTRSAVLGPNNLGRYVPTAG